jgi:MFS family permease
LSSKTKLTAPKPGFFYGWYLVAASWVTLFLIGGTAVAIFFKPMLEEFGWDRATLSLINALVLLVLASISPFIGRLIDRFGPRAVLFVCAGIQTAAGVLTGLATGLFQVSVGRFLFEIRYTHATQVLINRWFVKKRGRALGIVATGVPIGAIVLSPVSQYLVLNWGWRTTLFFWAGLTVIVIVPLLLLVRDRPEDKGLAPDGAPPAKPVNEIPSSPQVSPLRITGLPETGHSLTGALHTNAFWLLSLAHLICGIGCGLLMTHTVIFATDIGYPDMIGATFLSVQGVANLFGLLVTGQMSDRIARNKVLALTHFVRSLSFIMMVISLVLTGGSLWLLYPAMALFGFGWFTTAPLVSGLVADLFGNFRMGTIMGVVWSFHMIGMAIGTYAGGVTFQLTHSYLIIFLVQGILEFLAAVLAFLIRKKSRHAGKIQAESGC